MEFTDRTKHLALGAVAGAAALAMIGYSWDFMLTPQEAEVMADRRSTEAVATALAPFCVEKFRREPDVAAKLTELKKIDQWQRAAYIEKGGWAKSSGETSVDSAVAAACAESLVSQKVVKP